jgi:pimeloyl-ACP methyl ester carboxylesterase
MMRRRVVGLVAAALTLALVGCGGSSTSSGPPASTPTAAEETPSPVPSPEPSGGPEGMLADCASPGAKPFSAAVPGDQPVTVRGMLLGSGQRAVVLSYEWNSTPCAWADVAAELVGKGYLVALWEYAGLTGLDRIRELQAVVDQVRRSGAKQVALVGGSVGGCVSMIGASMVRPAVAGVAVFSCASWYDVSHRLPTTPLAAKVRVPTLYLTGATDSRVPVAEVRKDFGAIPAKDKRLIVVNGSDGHGIGLLLDPSAGTQIKPALLAFLDRVTR